MNRNMNNDNLEISRFPAKWSDLIAFLNVDKLDESAQLQLWKKLVEKYVASHPIVSPPQSGSLIRQYKDIFCRFYLYIWQKRETLEAQEQIFLDATYNGYDIWIKSKLSSLSAAERKALVNSKGIDQSTALHLAANRNHGDIAEYLLENGADTLAEDERGDTPLHVAAIFNSDLAAKAILNKDPGTIAIKGRENRTPFLAAALNGNLKIMALLAETNPQFIRNDHSSLMGAMETTIKNNRPDIAAWLQSLGTTKPGLSR